jgi:hypothetical protein
MSATTSSSLATTSCASSGSGSDPTCVFGPTSASVGSGATAEAASATTTATMAVPRMGQKVVNNLGGGSKCSQLYATIICPSVCVHVELTTFPACSQGLSLCTGRVLFCPLPEPQFVYEYGDNSMRLAAAVSHSSAEKVHYVLSMPMQVPVAMTLPTPYPMATRSVRCDLTLQDLQRRGILPKKRIIGIRVIYEAKVKNGTFERAKARAVAQGFGFKAGRDYTSVFSAAPSLLIVNPRFKIGRSGRHFLNRMSG